MHIKMQPKRDDTAYVAARFGEKLIIDNEEFDFSRIADGETLPVRAISCNRFAEDVQRKDGVLRLALFLPNPVNYSQAQAFPAPLNDPADGQLVFPKALPNENGEYDPTPEYDSNIPVTSGVIDWPQLVTKAMKEAAEREAELLATKSALAQRNASAALRITRIEDRIKTLGYGIEAGKATEVDEAEQAALLLSLSAWKGYKFDLGKVTSQATWPSAPVWPIEPPVPDIAADPELLIETQ